MQKYINNNQNVTDIITNEFYNLKEIVIIEDWVELDDLHTDKAGAVWAIQHYYDSRDSINGNVIIDSVPDMRTAVLILTKVQIIKALHPEMFYNVSTN